MLSLISESNKIQQLSMSAMLQHGLLGPQQKLLSNCTLRCLVVEEQLVLGKVPPSEAALALLGAYYIFNITYPKRLQNLGTSLEIVLLDRQGVEKGPTQGLQSSAVIKDYTIKRVTIYCMCLCHVCTIIIIRL